MWWVSLVTGLIEYVEDVSYGGSVEMLGPFRTFSQAKSETLRHLAKTIGIIERQTRQGSNNSHVSKSEG